MVVGEWGGRGSVSSLCCLGAMGANGIPSLLYFLQKQKTGVNNLFTRIIRGCADTCSERNIIGMDIVRCCGTDNCNSAEATGSMSALAPMAAYLVSWGILKAFDL